MLSQVTRGEPPAALTTDQQTLQERWPFARRRTGGPRAAIGLVLCEPLLVSHIFLPTDVARMLVG
jgi:hypothetical protein